MSTIGIVGAGQLGTVLARHLVALGHVVNVANSRGPTSLSNFARLTGARAVDVTEVALDADTLILAIPLGKVRTLPRTLITSLPRGAVVVDAGNYVPPRDGDIAEIDQGLPETAWVARQLGVSVVKAFNSISDISLDHGGRPNGASDRIALPVAGDDPDTRTAVMRLVEQLGFDAWNAGPLSDSWRQQIGQPAYATDGALKQLPGLLARAKHETVAAKRKDAMKLLAKLPPDFPKATLVRAARFMVGLDRRKPASWLAVLRLALVMLARQS